MLAGFIENQRFDDTAPVVMAPAGARGGPASLASESDGAAAAAAAPPSTLVRKVTQRGTGFHSVRNASTTFSYHAFQSVLKRLHIKRTSHTHSGL